jgi:hypothetical protein
MEAKLGLRADDLERFSVVARTIDEQDMTMLLRTTKVIDRKKMLDVLAKERIEKKHKGAVYYALTNDDKVLHFPDDHTVILANKEGGLTGLLDLAGKKSTHQAILRGAELASAGKHPMIVAVKLTPELYDKVIPPAARQKVVPNVTAANGLLATAGLDPQLALELTATYADGSAAKKAKTEVDGLHTMLTSKMNDAPPAKDPADAMARALVKSIAIDQRGSELVVKGKTDLQLQALVEAVARGFSGGSNRTRSINNLKNIALAIHNFHDANKSLPSPSMPHPQTGKPLLSWRVAILPYLDEVELYNQIKKDEPWDSPHNRQFWNKMPKAFQLPGKPADDKTYYQVFAGPGSAFPNTKRPGPPFTMKSGLTLVGITDGSSNTIFIVEAANAVNWMKPEDISFQASPNGFPLTALGNHWGDNTFHAAMGDATVRRFPRTFTPQQMQAFITAQGGEPVELPDF